MNQGGQTRRALLTMAFGGAVGLIAGARPRLGWAQAPTASWTPERLADDLFLLRFPGEANVLVQTGPDGVVLVDGGSGAQSDGLMQAVANLPSGSGRVQTLFNTHWHPEQTGLNERIGKAGGTIIATENTRLWLTTDVTWPWNGRKFARLPAAALPNKTFYKSGELPSGVKYGYLPDAAHTDGDLYVQFPKQNVLAAGDVLSNDGWPQVDWTTGGWIGGLVGGTQRLLALATAETRIVPGRGPVMSLTDLQKQAEMYATIYSRLSQLLNKGRSPGEAVAEKPAKEFEAQMGESDEFVRRSFESLWAYLSPDA